MEIPLDATKLMKTQRRSAQKEMSTQRRYLCLLKTLFVDCTLFSTILLLMIAARSRIACDRRDLFHHRLIRNAEAPLIDSSRSGAKGNLIITNNKCNETDLDCLLPFSNQSFFTSALCKQKKRRLEMKKRNQRSRMSAQLSYAGESLQSSQISLRFFSRVKLSLRDFLARRET
jgi:hypothetical protein